MGKCGVARGCDDAGNAHDELLRTAQGKAAQRQDEDDVARGMSLECSLHVCLIAGRACTRFLVCYQRARPLKAD